MSTRLPGTGLDLLPLSLGGTILGWGADAVSPYAALGADIAAGDTGSVGATARKSA